MKNFILYLLYLFSICSTAFNQEDFEINTALMETTYKIEGRGSVGTVFMLVIPSKLNPTHAFPVLVTASHVLDSMKGDSAVLHLRRKLPDGSFVKYPYKLQIRDHGIPKWTRHKDPSVDVAAMYMSLPFDAYNPKIFPISFLADDSTIIQYEIHPGDNLMCLGYPLNMEANEAGFPILRSGRIASYPLLPTKAVKTFLLDFNVFEGNSGGPVYFFESNRIFGGAPQFGTLQFIAGLVIKESALVQQTRTLYEMREQRFPLGLATIIHASYIVETINQLPPKE